MTGYGKSEFSIGQKTLNVEIRSLNSRFLDLNLKLPFEFKNMEIEIKKFVQDQLIRGKVDMQITLNQPDNQSEIKLNKALISSYITAFQDIHPDISVDKSFAIAMRLPEVFAVDEQLLDELQKQQFFDGIQHAINDFDAHRMDEGNMLETEFLKRVNHIENLLDQIKKFEPERLEKLKGKILTSLTEIENIDQNRFEQELIYYIERLDITEEKVRLKNHCEYFKEILNSEDSNGKKLNFIAQEMGREINTLGAKSNHSEMQRLVVEMKDDLEKVKEQILNVL